MEPIPQIINIGRQFGSGGKSVALEIGRLLDIPVYDNELITKAAEGSGFSAELFRKTDEKRGFLTFAPRALHPKAQVLGGILEDECRQLMQDFFRAKR